jgi:Tol biopolymer transport system component
VTGGTPKRVTANAPSYLHGWSPDGKYLIYTAERQGEFDIYQISVDGGQEVRLTNTKGLDDGSEYSPDGKYVYFNSARTGTMQLWRMKPDGNGQEQLTHDELNDWFPHVSPDGKRLVFISFPKDVAPDDHPFYKHVYLRTMPIGGTEPKVIAYLYGGQGTINVSSWAPDNRHVAFVSNTNVWGQGYAFEQNTRLGRGVNIMNGDAIGGTPLDARLKEKNSTMIKAAGFDHVRIVITPFKLAKSDLDHTSFLCKAARGPCGP